MSLCNPVRYLASAGHVAFTVVGVQVVAGNQLGTIRMSIKKPSCPAQDKS